jgi:crotonobetaine/carnitine-CoA ligase
MINTIPSCDICVLRYVLEHWAKTKPDQIFCIFEDDEIWTYAQTHKRAQSLGAALQAAGVGEGDHVVVWLPNGKECLEAYCALGYIGAVFVPINVAYRGDLLAHVIGNADAKLALVHPDLVTRLEDIDTAMLETIVTIGDTLFPVKGLSAITYEELLTKSGELAPL